MRDPHMYEMEDTSSDLFRFMENIPTQGYLGFSFGAMLASAFFFLTGRSSIALFLGQWVPSIGMFALVYKLLRPSHERPLEQMKDTAGEFGSKMKDTAEDMGSKLKGAAGEAGSRSGVTH